MVRGVSQARMRQKRSRMLDTLTRPVPCSPTCLSASLKSLRCVTSHSVRPHTTHTILINYRRRPLQLAKSKTTTSSAAVNNAVEQSSKSVPALHHRRPSADVSCLPIRTVLCTSCPSLPSLPTLHGGSTVLECCDSPLLSVFVPIFGLSHLHIAFIASFAMSLPPPSSLCGSLEGMHFPCTYFFSVLYFRGVIPWISVQHA